MRACTRIHKSKRIEKEHKIHTHTQANTGGKQIRWKTPKNGWTNNINLHEPTVAHTLSFIPSPATTPLSRTYRMQFTYTYETVHKAFRKAHMRTQINPKRNQRERQRKSTWVICLVVNVSIGLRFARIVHRTIGVSKNTTRTHTVQIHYAILVALDIPLQLRTPSDAQHLNTLCATHVIAIHCMQVETH